MCCPCAAYQAFGLKILSNHRFNEFVCDPSFDSIDSRGYNRDIDVLVGDSFPDSDRDPITFDLVWDAVAAFKVSESRILASPKLGVPSTLINLPIHGPVFATALQLRGRLVFHAAAVRVEDTCIIIAGDKTAGKSTLLAYFVSRGHDVLADDVVSIELLGHDGFKVFPSFPSMKIDPNVQNFVNLNNIGLLPAPIFGFPKILLDLRNVFCKNYLNKSIFIALEYGSEFALSYVERRQSLPYFLKHCYLAGVLKGSNRDDSIKSQFKLAASFSDLASLYKLSNPKRPELLSPIYDSIIAAVHK